MNAVGCRLNEKSNAHVLLQNCKTFQNSFWISFCVYAKTVARRCSVKKVFSDFSQNSRENTCTRVSFLIKLQASACNFVKRDILAQVFFSEFCKIWAWNFIKKRPWHRCFPVNFAKFLGTPFLSEHFRWLRLCMRYI